MDNQPPDQETGPPLSEKQKGKLPARTSNVAVEEKDILLNEPRLDQEIALLVAQYLESRSFGHIAKIIEEQVLERSPGEYEEEVRDVERAIQDGDFGQLESLLARPGLLKPQSQKAFLYLCYRQQFLEHVENRESQKAFNLLSKRLKPLEHYQPVPYDFYSLSYLTSAGTVHDAPSFRDWAGVEPEREALVRAWREVIDAETSRGADVKGQRPVPPGRLIQLLKQAGGWQVGHCRAKRGPWKVASLLYDYQPIVLPSTKVHGIAAHKRGAKCVSILASDGSTAISGGSDSLLRISSTVDGSVLHTLTGHTSRVWDVDVSNDHIASASGDGTVRIWTGSECISTMGGQGGDVYSVRWKPAAFSSTNAEQGIAPSRHITTASYDRILRTFDVDTGQLVRTFSGHSQAALCVAYDPAGTLLASGSKDRQVRLWDAVGGVCVNTMTSCLGEVTSVEFDAYGRYLLVGSKDNSNRLWDMRMQRTLYRYTGHSNTTKNFVRCSFALDSAYILGGSEDGNIYIWEREPTAEPTPPHAEIPSLGLPTPSTPRGSPSLIPNNPSGVLGLSAPVRASAAYYPKPTPTHHKAYAHAHGGTGLMVRPHAVLRGHKGTVYDVRGGGGVVVSAGEDGVVAVWEGEEDGEDGQV